MAAWMKAYHMQFFDNFEFFSLERIYLIIWNSVFAMNIIVIPIILLWIFVIYLFWMYSYDTGTSIFSWSMDSTRWHISCWQIKNSKRVDNVFYLIESMNFVQFFAKFDLVVRITRLCFPVIHSSLVKKPEHLPSRVNMTFHFWRTQDKQLLPIRICSSWTRTSLPIRSPVPPPPQPLPAPAVLRRQLPRPPPPPHYLFRNRQQWTRPPSRAQSAKETETASSRCHRRRSRCSDALCAAASAARCWVPSFSPWNTSTSKVLTSRSVQRKPQTLSSSNSSQSTFILQLYDYNITYS